MSFEKMLILESKWSEDITETLSASEVYRSIESFFSLQDHPFRIITRPLLSEHYINDIDQFVSLECNKKGPNIVILAAHGRRESAETSDGLEERRILEGYDGTIDLSGEIDEYVEQNGNRLKRTIFILDSCEIGTDVDEFLEYTGAYGVIGYSKEVGWVDSAIFSLALLLKFQEEGVFHLQRARTGNSKPEKVLREMKSGSYGPLMEELGVEFGFRQ